MKKVSKILIRVLSIMLFSVIFSFLLTSNILARYLSGESGNDGARVAKWNIDFNDGTSFNSIISSTHLESGSRGEWGLDIANKSEVLAKFADNSSVKIRLQSPDFHVDHAHETWDFLVDNNHNEIDNPINFKAYMYNCSLAELEAANGDLSNIKEIEVFDTKDNSDALRFQLVIVDGELYFECVVNVGEKLNVDDKFLLAIEEGKACLKIFWEVDQIFGAVSTDRKFKAYSVVEHSAEYDGEFDDIITIGTKKYVIAYQTYDYFEYLIYTSSLGGEIMITFTDDLGKEYVRRCTKLSNDEKEELEARTKNVNSLDELNRYIEYLEYQEFEKFLQMKSDYSLTTGYLGLGLECRIILDLRVEQVD